MLLFTWKGSMLLLLSVLNALSSIQGLGARGPGLGNLGGAITLLEYGFFMGDMGFIGDGTPTPTPTPTPTALRGSRPACSPLHGLEAVLHAAFW